MLTQERLKELFSYDPNTGVFVRIEPFRNCSSKVGEAAGWSSAGGYVQISYQGGDCMAHRLAILYMDGYLPKYSVDHINRVRNDNRYSNLRVTTTQEQSRNRTIFRKNKHRVTGVKFIAKTSKWNASITVDKKLKHIGNFDTLLDAACARFAAEQCIGFYPSDDCSSAKQYIDLH